MRPRVPWIYYLLSLATLFSGAVLALRAYPGHFDWQYTVVSALASTKHNPQGGAWFAGGLGLALVWLWPFAGGVWGRPEQRRCRFAKTGLLGLRVGIAFGALMALEALLPSELWRPARKTHELLAALAFLFAYGGLIATSIGLLRHGRRFWLPAGLALLPLLAIGISQLALYLSQRDLGWVDQSWRELGVPLWQSFAFWQWLALVSLWLGLGLLAFSRHRSHLPIRNAAGS